MNNPFLIFSNFYNKKTSKEELDQKIGVNELNLYKLTVTELLMLSDIMINQEDFIKSFIINVYSNEFIIKHKDEPFIRNTLIDILETKITIVGVYLKHDKELLDSITNLLNDIKES